MRLRILPKEEIPRMVQALQSDYRVVGPAAKGPQFAFEEIDDPEELRLDYNISILSPKVFLQPPEERIAKIHLGEEPEAEEVIESEPTVIFGAHTCDLRAIQLLDEVFSMDHPDAHYLKRREETLIISLECLEPCDEHSFCKDMGTLTAEEGYDLHLTDLGEVYAVDVGTEKGKELLEQYTQAREATDEDVRKLNEVLGAKWPRFSYRLDFEAGELPSLLATAYEHPLWVELGDRCLACGSCTNVCPTCYCFNVTDTVSLDQSEATRTRKWDSCQLDEFARVAGGENFREARAARQRHRFFRKGKWIYEKTDILGCVGCGRCIRTCLVHINIVDGFNAIHSSR
jgi:ferredoxin